MQLFYETHHHSVQIGSIGNAFPPHLHSHIELVHAFSGPAFMWIDGQEYILTEGDTAIAFSNRVHAYGNNDGASGLMLIFPPDISADFGNTLMTRYPKNPVLRAENSHPDIHAMIAALMEESRTDRNEAVIRAYIQVLLARLIPKLTLQKSNPEGERDLLMDAMRYLSEHFDQPVTLDVLAKVLGASRYHLSHLFNAQLGMNFRSYVNTLRIDRARILLTSNATPVTQICYECGFENQRTFNRAFQSACGMTPTQYRTLNNPLSSSK